MPPSLRLVPALHVRARRGIVLAMLALVPLLGHSQRLPASSFGADASPDLSPVNLHLVTPRVQAGRWVWMGDSFAVPSRRRVSFASLLTWPLGRIGAVTVGASARLAQLVPDPAFGRTVTYQEGYVLAPGTPLESTMGLPLFRLLEWAPPTRTAVLGSVHVLRAQLADGTAAASGGLFVGGASIRPLLYAQPGAEARGRMVLGDGPFSVSPIPEQDGFALGQPLALPDAPSTYVTVEAHLLAPGFVHVAGSVLSGAPGHTAQFLGDASWSYWGFGQDADPTLPDSVKRFRTAHFASYLQATTLDSGQPTVVTLYTVQEKQSASRLRGELVGVVDRTRDAFLEANLPEPVFLFIHPHAIATPFNNDVDSNTRAGVVMRGIALEDPRVAFASLYDATDGVVFDGRPAAHAWLRDHGLDVLSYGTHYEGQDGPLRLIEDHRANLLDANKLHPTETGAAFFSYVLGQVLTEYAVPGRLAAASAAERPVGRLTPNPVRPGAGVTGAEAGVPVLDALGRRVGEVGADGALQAPSVAGVYLVGRARLVVQ